MYSFVVVGRGAIEGVRRGHVGGHCGQTTTQPYDSLSFIGAVHWKGFGERGGGDTACIVLWLWGEGSEGAMWGRCGQTTTEPYDSLGFIGAVHWKGFGGGGGGHSMDSFVVVGRGASEGVRRGHSWGTMWSDIHTTLLLPRFYRGSAMEGIGGEGGGGVNSMYSFVVVGRGASERVRRGHHGGAVVTQPQNL